eukprot:scaffold79047_cov64-Phaeocystis_antarctica.AAC.3
MLAPAFSSSCTLSLRPLAAATIRVVYPAVFCRSTLALCSSSKRTIACWPCPTATMRAVQSPGPRRASTCPSFFSHSTTGCSSPRRAARPISSGSTMATLAGGVAACCRSTLAMAAWPSSSARLTAVPPSTSHSSVLAPVPSNSCTHSV